MLTPGRGRQPGFVNSPISLETLNTLQNHEGDVVSLHIKASDANSGATLTYTVSGLPNGLSINASTGVISGTIAAGTADEGGAFTPVVTATDGKAVASMGFNWNINPPISLVSMDTLQNNEGDVVSLHLQGTYATSGATLTWTASGLPAGLGINASTGLISGTIAAGNGNEQVFYPQITASDGTAVASLGFTWNVHSPISLVAMDTVCV